MQRRLFVSTLLPLLASLSVGLWPAPLAASEHKAQMDAGASFSRWLNIIDQAGIIIPGEGFKRDLCTQAISLSCGVKNVLNRSFKLSFIGINSLIACVFAWPDKPGLKAKYSSVQRSHNKKERQ